MQVKFISTAVAFLWLALAQISTAAPLNQDDPDGLLALSVARSVNAYPRFTVFDDVNVQSEAGVVTLTGKVTMPYKKEEIGKRVEGVDGVKALRNQIEVLSVSIEDDRLRQRIARAIYGNSAFWHYAAMPNPPIHIVVEHSRVTLTGVVYSEADRLLARSLATGFGELGVTNCLRTEAK
ncbi:MAG TPA: BON domain-containing protein [Vicinamibacterales bacterium]|nr:BON domain-containing protein [Vicinamibacterales bacterium]